MYASTGVSTGAQQFKSMEDDMDYRKMYEEKKLTPQQAARYVRSGDTVGSTTAICEPLTIINEMCEYALAEGLSDIKLVKNCMMPMNARYTKPDMKGIVTPVGLFLGSSELRQMAGQGLADFIPCNLSQQLDIWRDIKPRIATILVSPMDDKGYFTFTMAPLDGRTLVDEADIVLAETSPYLPRIQGSNMVHISEIDGVVESEIKLPVLPLTEPAENDIKIAEYVVERIPDGACIQFGIGRVPDAVGMLLKEKKNLGIHTELMCSSMYELIKAGAVDNSRKNIDKGMTVFTFCGGTQEMYDYLDDNPAVRGMPVDYVNNPNVIAQNDNVISINACLEMDIFGQVCSESIGPRRITGSGGQLDFIRGANASKGGRSFLVVHSTAKGGTVSTIKPMLTEGAHVTTPMNEVDCVVTEYGVAELMFKTASQRVKSLISIAHPDMRDELTFHAKKIGLMI